MKTSFFSRLTLALLLTSAPLLAAEPPHNNPNNGTTALSETEKQAGWKLLFDGKSTAGWRRFGSQGFPEKGWVVEEGVLHHLPKAGGGDIITDKNYDDFEVQWDWKIAEGANSGFKYFITETRKSAIGHEYQLIDDDRHPDAKRGTTHGTAGFYDVLPCTTTPQTKPVGQWNTSRILVQGKHVEHWLNGAKVLEYELDSSQVREAVAKSKFKTVEGFGSKVPSHFLLQDHGDEVWFRNLKIRELGKKG